MEISADGNASIIGVRRTEVLIFNFQGTKASAFLSTLSLTDFIALENARVIIENLHIFQSKTIVIPRQIWYN